MVVAILVLGAVTMFTVRGVLMALGLRLVDFTLGIVERPHGLLLGFLQGLPDLYRTSRAGLGQGPLDLR